MSEGYGAGAGACVGAGAWGGSEAGMVRGQGVTVTCRFWLERAEMCLPHVNRYSVDKTEGSLTCD